MDYQPYAYTQVQNISIPSSWKERIANCQKEHKCLTALVTEIARANDILPPASTSGQESCTFSVVVIVPKALQGF